MIARLKIYFSTKQRLSDCVILRLYLRSVYVALRSFLNLLFCFNIFEPNRYVLDRMQITFFLNPFIRHPLSISGINAQRIFDAFQNSKEKFKESETFDSKRDDSDERLKPDGTWEGGDDRQEKMHATELQKTIKLALFLMTICVAYITYSSLTSKTANNQNTDTSKKEYSDLD